MEALERLLVQAARLIFGHQQMTRVEIRVRGGDVEHAHREAAGVLNRDAVFERAALAEDDRLAGLSRRGLRGEGELGTSGERDRLVAVDPGDRADPKPDQREREDDQDQVARPAGAQECDRPAAALEPGRRA